MGLRLVQVCKGTQGAVSHSYRNICPPAFEDNGNEMFEGFSAQKLKPRKFRIGTLAVVVYANTGILVMAAGWKLVR
jgi:hypothetical protein